MKETTALVKPLPSFHTQMPVYAKLVFLFLSLGAGVFLLSSHSVDYSSSTLQVLTPFVSNSQETEPPFTSNDKVSKTETSTEIDSEEEYIDLLQSVKGSPPSSTSNEVSTDEARPKCDLFKGDWIPNLHGPSYNNNTCMFIEPQQDCMKNGRPDSGYLFWRWKPRDCELPKLNPKRFLNLMRNKEFAFIGDSISRNQAQSLLCILSQVELPEEINKVKHQGTWIFPSYNFTLIGIWSPYLIKADIVEDNDNGSSTPVDIKLHLDKLDDIWTKQYSDFDYVNIAAGPWFTRTTIFHENNIVQGCHYCPGRNLTDLGFGYSYRKALNRVFNFVIRSSHKPQVLFRTITPSHFEYGKWNEGGYCNKKVPFKESEASLSEGERIMYEVGVEEFDKAINGTSENGAFFKLFDTTRLSLLRRDGHPGAYRQYYPFALDNNATVQSDCLHWCLPGPIDTWNELMFEMLMRG